MGRNLFSLLLVCLWATVQVSAQGTPRQWLLTAADLKKFLPEGFKVRPKLEQLTTAQDLFEFISTYRYHYCDDDQHVVVHCLLTRDKDSFTAGLNYQGVLVGMKYGHSGPRPRDLSKTVSAGQESSCWSREGKDYGLAFHEHRTWGWVIISGPQLTSKQLNGLIRHWVKRAAGADPPRKKGQNLASGPTVNK